MSAVIKLYTIAYKCSTAHVERMQHPTAVTLKMALTKPKLFNLATTPLQGSAQHNLSVPAFSVLKLLVCSLGHFDGFGVEHKCNIYCKCNCHSCTIAAVHVINVPALV